MESTAQDLVDAVVAQRDRATNDLATAVALIAAQKRRINELEEQIKRLENARTDNP